MKKIFLIGFTLALLAAATGCQNNGHIGSLFGTSALTQYTVNAQRVDSVVVGEDTIPVENVFFSFQNNVVNIVAVLDEFNNRESRFGTWARNGNVFELDFKHHDDYFEEGTDVYAAPAYLGMISTEPMIMTVVDDNSKAFTLSWEDPHGNLRTYRLRKTW